MQTPVLAQQTRRPLTMKWEVTIAEFEDADGKKYKVTRRLPELLVAETKIFRTKEAAKKQFDEWLR